MAGEIPMTGGDGAYSYVRNSQFQKEAANTVKEMIHEAIIEKLILTSTSSTVAIADLGCSVGPNTFFTVQDLIQSAQNKLVLQGMNPKNIEFHIFFNDLIANDFNTLFASLPADRQYHAAAAPGSFYGRLFPRASINVAYSAFALQWLTKQPQGVPNEGRIHYGGASANVLRSYSDQFERDMEVFLSARAEEMVRGGLMFLVMPGVPDGVPRSELFCGPYFNFVGDCLMELASEGAVDKAKIDAFNLPMYDPTIGEMRRGIEKNGCFSIERMELMNPRLEMGPIDEGSLMMHLRAAMEGVFSLNFGTSVVEKLFANISAKSQQITLFLETAHLQPNQLFLVLKRN